MIEVPKFQNIKFPDSNFWLSEFVVSTEHPDLAAHVWLTPEDIQKIAVHVYTILQPVRDFYQQPVFITSGKRSLGLNHAVGGTPTSDHLDAMAVDWCVLAKKNKKGVDHEATEDAFLFLKDFSTTSFGQLILYCEANNAARMVHTSLPTGKHHGEVLVSKRGALLPWEPTK